MKRFILTITVLLLIYFSGCSVHQDLEPLAGDVLNWRGEFFIRDGKVLLLKEDKQYYYSTAEIENAAKINNAVSIHSSRFVQCDDGTFKDLWETEDRNALYPTVDVINELNETCGIWKIIDSGDSLSEGNWTVNIYANDGTLYIINENPPDGIASEFEKTERIQVSTYGKETEIISKKEYLMIGRDLHEVFLNEDGTVSCDYYPEVSAWTDIVDISCYEEKLLGLTSDNKLLSAGCDLLAEKVAEFGFIHQGYNIPYALTSDGKLIFADYSDLMPSHNRNVLAQAESFTDVLGFTYTTDPELIILVLRSDGSLVATTNDVYDPEYVGQP